jgi:hypothetical protein
MNREWCEFAVYSDAALAEVVAGLLRGESVPVHVASDEPMPGLVRGFRILVPPDMLHRAKWIAAQAQLSEEELVFLATGQLPGKGSPEDSEP